MCGASGALWLRPRSAHMQQQRSADMTPCLPAAPCGFLRALPRWSSGLLLAALLLAPRAASAQLVVPGTGEKVTKVGDDFEDPQWSYVFNLPKGSDEND